MKVKVRVHKATFMGSKVPHLFINVRNNYKKRSITINSVDFIGESIPINGTYNRLLGVNNTERPLPVELPPQTEWETWELATGAANSVGSATKKHVYHRFLVKVNDSIFLTSRRRKRVTQSGAVPGDNLYS